MKKILVFAILGMTCFVMKAQNMSQSGAVYNGNIYHLGGNVGIGTTDPQEKLHVSGNVVTSSELILVRGGGKGAHGASTGTYPVSAYESYGWNFTIQNVNGNGQWSVGNSSRTTKFLTVKENGNVGIGTTLPQSLLAVNGKITAKEVEVTLTGWADFVFNKDFALISLEDLEKYINENKHLPDVPSEKEVLENGLNLGENNAVLLQKIEELTLYVIELNKENKELKKRIENLESNK
jgi:hypothetical protein